MPYSRIISKPSLRINMEKHFYRFLMGNVWCSLEEYIIKLYQVCITSKVVNNARRPQAVCVRGKRTGKKIHEILPYPKCTTTSTAGRGPRQPRDGWRRNTSHALAQLARFNLSLVRGNRHRTALAISKNDECYT